MIGIKDYFESEKTKLKNTIETNGKPKLLAVSFGNPSFESYIKGLAKDCREVGIELSVLRFTYERCTDELEIGFIKEQCARADGIIFSSPIPSYAFEIQNLIPANKDVDGMVSTRIFNPCTPSGIMDYLTHTGFNFKGINACVVGRSDLVGRPLAKTLVELDATVTLCHSHSDLKRCFENQDLIFTAIKPVEYLDRSYFTDIKSPNQITVIDIGCGLNKDGKFRGNLTEDAIEFLRASDRVITNVGCLTRLQLMRNTFEAMRLLRGER